MRRLLKLLLFGLAIGFGLGWALLKLGGDEPAVPDTPAVVAAVRESARLETLEVQLWKKVVFAPEPRPGATLLEDVAGWVRYSLDAPRGKAIVFATARIGVDLARLDERSLRVAGRTVYVALPPLTTIVELRPGDTEIIGSNLDSEQTAKLLQLAKDAFEREVGRDATLSARARDSAERSIRGILLYLGFSEVRFVSELPAAAGPS